MPRFKVKVLLNSVDAIEANGVNWHDYRIIATTDNKKKYGIIYLSGILKTFNRQIDLFRQIVFFSAKNYLQSSHYKN